MKRIKLFLLTILCVFSFIDSVESHTHKLAFESFDDVIEIKDTVNQTVYICSGQYAYAYHSVSNCAGLNNCKGQVQYTDESTAINSYNRVPCCKCWDIASDRCIDDNPYNGGAYGGGDNSEALAIMAIAMVATSAIILSNDLYVYPIVQFGKNRFYANGTDSQSDFINGIGLGFRKTFDHSALEYGANLYQTSNYYNHNYGDNKTFWNKLNQVSFYFNYAQEIFQNKTNEKIKIFAGPSVNYLNDFGYGGLVGGRLKLFNRLSLDLRYEYTTQTNQIQMGLIFTYQKKYFWQ